MPDESPIVTALGSRRSLEDFITLNEITMEVEDADRRSLVRKEPVTREDGWEHFAWKVTLVRGDRSMKVDYHTGTGHAGPRRWDPFRNGGEYTHGIPELPTAENVLDSLASDSSSYEDARNFDDWCDQFGYSNDSRKALAMYQACAEQAKELRHLLGPNLYSLLLWDTERL